MFLLAAGSVLLLSDLRNRGEGRHDKDVYRIALVRFSSNQVVMESEEGFLDKIRQSEPYQDGRLIIKQFNAEGDLPTANTIAQTILGNNFDMVVTISTPMLQVMANANKKGKVIHVFTCVTDPYAAGVEITGTGPEDHPPHLVGIGTFQPVEDVFRMARLMNPSLKKVGVVWCASESASEACVLKAREVCRDLGIELVEKSIEAVSQVYEAALSLGMAQAEAFYIGGDNVVEPAMGAYCTAASKFGIPVISNSPRHAFSGAMLNLGANYYQIGEITVDLVLSIFNGLPLSSIEVKNIVPQQLFINDSIRRTLKGRWTIPDEMRPLIDSLIQ